MNRKNVLAVLSIQIIYLGSVYAQTYSFPQNVKYPYGFMSEVITSDDARKVYENWKNDFIRTCGDNEARVIKLIDGAETTISEGMGYGMAIVAYAGDKGLFDKLLNYYVARQNNHGMMNWIYQNCDTGDNQKNGATDGEMDAALALVVATRQWLSDTRYKFEAGRLIDSMQIHYFTRCGDIIVQKPGDTFGGCTCTNPSYYSPAYYRVFAMFKEEQGNTAARDFWNEAAEDAYVPLLKNANPYTGLVYAWTNADGGDPSDCYYEVTGGGTYNSYQYDACRTPWRIANDYLWWGSSKAEEWTKKITRFVKAPVYMHSGESGEAWYGAGGIENVVDSYWTNGLRRIDTETASYGHDHNLAFVGAFALASMSSGQEDADAFMKEFRSLVPASYYESCLCVLYTFLATGNFWNPYGIE